MALNGFSLKDRRVVKELAKDGKLGWNDLTDKPFYDETLEPIVWDGNTEGLEVVSVGGTSNLYKVSDRFVPLDDALGGIGKMHFASGLQVSTLTADLAVPASTYGFTDPNSWVVQFSFGELVAAFIHSDETVKFNGIELSVTRGVYFIKNHANDIYLTETIFPSKVKHIDTKYLPSVMFTMSEETGGTITCNRAYAEAYEILKVFPFALWSNGRGHTDGGLITNIHWAFYGNHGSASPTGIKFRRQLKDGTFDTFIFNENGLLAFEDDYFEQV